MTGAALIDQHRRLGREAEDHKRAAGRHRRAARAAREEQAAIEARLRAMGIAVTIEHQPRHSGEGDIHGRRGNSDTAS